MLMSEERPYKCPHSGCHKDYKHERNLMEHIRGSHPKSRCQKSRCQKPWCAPKRCSGQGSSQSVSPPKRRCVKPSAPAPARPPGLFHGIDLNTPGQPAMNAKVLMNGGAVVTDSTIQKVSCANNGFFGMKQ